MNLAELDGKPFTLWLTDDQEESAVFAATARWTGAALFLERASHPPFEIRVEWRERIQAVTNEEVKRILLGAEYFLRLRVGTLRSEASDGEFERTGLKWPE